jgi:hypothetical protein
MAGSTLGVRGSEPLLEVADLFEMVSTFLFQLTGYDELGYLGLDQKERSCSSRSSPSATSGPR